MAATNAVGRKIALGLGEETVYNTPVAITEWLPIEPEADIKRIVNKYETNVLQQGRMARKENVAIGTLGSEANMPMPWPVVGSGTLFKHFFGKVTTPAIADNAYVHTYVVNPLGLFIGLTLCRHKDNHQLTSSGNKLKSLAISAKINDYARLVWGATGGTVVAAAVTGTPEVTLLTQYPYFTFDKITANYATAALALTGFDVTLSNELFEGDEQSYSMGSQARAMLRTGMMAVEGTMTRRFLTDGTSDLQSKFYNHAIATDHYPLIITMDSAVLIGAATTYKAVLTLDEVHVDQPELSTDAGLVMETIKFKGRWDGTVSGVTLAVTNAIATPVTAAGVD